MGLKQDITGTTLIELVTVMLILGIIVAIVAPRFFSPSDFSKRGYLEQTLSAIRYAQKLAIASGCDVRVSVTAGGYALDEWINAGVSCTAGAAGIVPVTRPGGGTFADPPPDGVVVGGPGFPALFYFDSIGRPRDANAGPTFSDLLVAPINLTIGGRTLTIEAETGYTRCTSGC